MGVLQEFFSFEGKPHRDLQPRWVLLRFFEICGSYDVFGIGPLYLQIRVWVSFMNFINPSALGTFGKRIWHRISRGGPSRIDSVDDRPVRKVTMPIDRIKGPGGGDQYQQNGVAPLRRTIRFPWAMPLCFGTDPPATNLNPSAESSANSAKADKAVGGTLGPWGVNDKNSFADNVTACDFR